MKKLTLMLAFIALFLAQDLLAQPVGRRINAIDMDSLDVILLADAMLAYIDSNIVSEHSCNNEFGNSDGAAGSIHGPEMFLNWHRNYLWEMEESIASTLNAIPGSNGLLPRWTASDGFGIPGMERLLPLLNIDTMACVDACDLSGNGTNCYERPDGLLANPYLFPNPLDCDTWAAFDIFSEDLRQNYHNDGHNNLGGVMQDFRSPASPIFWIWHGMIDDVYWDWQMQCDSTGIEDIYMQDTPADTGIEANPDTGPMWISSDIWVRQDQDMPTGGMAIPHGSYSYANEGNHQNPEYKMFSDNYVYVKIRNRGADEFSGGRLRVYWSKASTGLDWSSTWIDYAPGGLLHGDELTPINPGLYPQEVSLLIPPIPGNGHWIMEIPWRVPNPADFTNDIHHFCLLARIVSAFDPMDTPEGTAIGANVRNNNNIVWKNVSVMDTVLNNFQDPGPDLNLIFRRVGFAGVYVTNTTDDAQNTTVGFKSLVNDQKAEFFKTGGIAYARMEDKLFDLWKQGGLQNNGVKYLGKLGNRHYIRIFDPKASIYNIKLPPHANLAMEMGFMFTQRIKKGQHFDYDVCQFDGKKLIGGERYEINYFPNNQIAKPQAKISELSNDMETVFDLIIAPNPASDKFTATFKLAHDQSIHMSLYDLNGKIVHQSIQVNLKAGIHTQAFNTSDLQSGIYFLKAIFGNEMTTQKVIIE